jgi:hypothetical protein
VHLGIRPYADDCHTNEFSAPIVETLATPNKAGVYAVSAVPRPTNVGPLAARRWHTAC